MTEVVRKLAPQDKKHSKSRRSFVRNSTLGVGGLFAAASTHAGSGPTSDDHSKRSEKQDNKRAKASYRNRVEAARQHFVHTQSLPRQHDNGDDRRYAKRNFYASFTKTLPHNRFGEVDRTAYRLLKRALKSGESTAFDQIPLDPQAARKLANPQGAFRHIYEGMDGHATRMRTAPEFSSAEAAAEMGEVYWLALTRDVPFSRYRNDALIGNALRDLNAFSQTVGPKNRGRVTADTLFRGSTSGDLTGPYISQLLWMKVPYGPTLIEQRYETPVAGQNFMVDEQNWLNVQRGGAPLESIGFDSDYRYIYNNRSLGEFVHRDVLFQAYFNAALILNSLGPDAIDPHNPYVYGITNQGAFTSLGGPFVFDLVSQAGNLALAGAWFQKWRVHRRLRPEAYGGRVHFMMTAQRNYDLHPDILHSQAVQRAYDHNGSYLLPMAYTEGSPTHPSFPAGHATIAGACTTVLKAFFNEDYVFSDPVAADDNGFSLNAYHGSELTIGGELNKLAHNIALGRDAAGVHYRSDGADGLLVGEQQAIALLQDASRAVSEDFEGFYLTRFDGTRIVIRDGEVRRA